MAFAYSYTDVNGAKQKVSDILKSIDNDVVTKLNSSVIDCSSDKDLATLNQAVTDLKKLLDDTSGLLNDMKTKGSEMSSIDYEVTQSSGSSGGDA